ncbi:pleckstrin homology domain-containing family G member 7 [Bos javanicus]|uniref:pleckstrin homology domain-containing family G member 7 n=1 Tax=Bos javanicus TaxID=9906 RepID=UPI002AA791D4|nr:pleckstrin homology domain-containing family G member 7 [Bos javanicus]
MEKMEPSRQEVQPAACKASPPYSLESLSKKHCQNQGNLLHFDRQAPGRLTTSPTLRRLRSRGCGSVRGGARGTATAHAPPQHVALDVRTWGDLQEYPGSASPLSNKVCESTEESSHSVWPLRLHSRLPLDSERALDSAESVELQMGPGEERALPVPQDLEEGSHPQASFPRKGDHSAPSHTPGPPGPQKEELHQYRFYEHRRSSVVLNLPGLEVFPGDLLVSAGAADYLCHPLLLLNSESKKPRWPFSKRGVQGKDKNKHISDLEDCLSSLKITDFRDYEFHTLKDKTWNEVMEMHQKLPTNQLDLRKQQEAVWELFTSECTYFLDHLLVLKMIFMNTLKYLQTHEYLLDVDLWRLFANLEELSQTSFGFVNSLFRIFKDYVDICETSPSLDFISVLTKYFRGSLCQSHQTYCLNYSAAVFYLESLKQRHDFGIYLKWCEQHDQCRRLHLPELLVAPLHRLTRYPLLLKNIWKRSTDSTEKIMIYSIKEKVEKAIQDLEGKVKWLDNFQKFRHLQEIVVWPPLWDRDKRFFIPECLKHIFKEHMAENILSPTNRHLLYEGKLTLAESTRFLDVYLFLFDDFLLVTKTKRNKKKLGGSDPGLMCPSLTAELQTVIREGGSCTVIDQPIPLDRLLVRGLDPLHVSVFGLRNAFLIQHENRYRQCIAAFLLQAQTENIKRTWIAQITAAISCFTKSQETKKLSSFPLPAEPSGI